jgi:hypothetical protein
MRRHLAVKQATVEGASDRLRVGHMLFPPSRVWPRESFLTAREAFARSALPREREASRGARP